MAVRREVKIKCKAQDRIALDDLTGLQGGLKLLQPANLEKLRASILHYGFIAPLFVWKDKAGTLRILDGHQRVVALQSLRDEGWHIPKLPVATVEASSERDAKRKWTGVWIVAESPEDVRLDMPLDFLRVIAEYLKGAPPPPPFPRGEVLPAREMEARARARGDYRRELCLPG